MTPAFWSGKNVLLTGHTGFKGSWLSLWLQQLGANITGLSDAVPTNPSLFEAANIGADMTSLTGDVRDLEPLQRVLDDARPDIVFHLAAQSLVRRSYADPVTTYATNVQGTVHLLEAVRQLGGVRAVIIVTSDKCYENQERDEGYAEGDPLGGYDPYSSSKACAELVTAAYRDSFFSRANFEQHLTAVATVRSGNVIGGGDWSEDRLVPDLISALRADNALVLRNPASIRPWQFVLDPLNGYLELAEHLFEHGPEFAEAWNFGPDDSDSRSVGDIATQLSKLWGAAQTWRQDGAKQPHETRLLNLDSSKARSRLAWASRVRLETALQWIVEWYREFDAGRARQVSLSQLQRFEELVA